jgi:hypothetical protein
MHDGIIKEQNKKIKEKARVTSLSKKEELKPLLGTVQNQT